MSQKNNQHLLEAMAHLRDYRLWVVKNRVDAWVSRQALVMALEIDTIVATGHGVKVEDLEKFDDGCRTEAKNFVEKEGRSL